MAGRRRKRNKTFNTKGMSIGRGPIVVDVKKFFFNQAQVEQAINDMVSGRDNFIRYAMYLRKVAINSIKTVRAKKGGKAWSRPSLPGTPPRSRDVRRRMKRIEYGWDNMRNEMLVGSLKFASKNINPVPSVHEKGRHSVITRNIYPARVGRARSRAQANAYKRGIRSGRIQPQKPIGTKTIVKKYPKRPFMVPALEKTVNKFPRMWAQGATLG